jgi:hypothetical protein
MAEKDKRLKLYSGKMECNFRGLTHQSYEPANCHRYALMKLQMSMGLTDNVVVGFIPT